MVSFRSISFVFDRDRVLVACRDGAQNIGGLAMRRDEFGIAGTDYLSGPRACGASFVALEPFPSPPFNLHLDYFEEDEEQKRITVGTFIDPSVPSYAIAVAKTERSGFFTRLMSSVGFDGKWISMGCLQEHEKNPVPSGTFRFGLVCFVDRIPKHGERIRITGVGEKCCWGKVV